MYFKKIIIAAILTIFIWAPPGTYAHGSYILSSPEFGNITIEISQNTHDSIYTIQDDTWGLVTINEVSQWVYSEMFGYLPFSEFDQQLTQPCISQDIQDTQNISRSTNWLSHVYYTLLDSWTNIFLQDIPQEHTLCTDQDDTGRTDIQERPRGG